MTRPDSFFRIVPIVLELYRRKWQGGNIYLISMFKAIVTFHKWLDKKKGYNSHHPIVHLSSLIHNSGRLIHLVDQISSWSRWQNLQLFAIPCDRYWNDQSDQWKPFSSAKLDEIKITSSVLSCSKMVNLVVNNWGLLKEGRKSCRAKRYVGMCMKG